MKKSTSTLLRLATFAGLLALSPVASAATIYTQDFTNTGGSDVGIGGYNWSASSSLNGGNVATVNGAVGTGFARVSSSDFFVFIGATAGTVDRGLASVSSSQFSASANFGDLTSVTFDQRNNNAATVTRVAALVGSQWYVSTTSFAGASGGQSGSTFVAQSLSVTGSTTWNTLDYTTGSTPFSVGATAIAGSDISGAISAMGFYIVGLGTGNNGRIDNYTITAIPEPSSFAALIGSCMIGFVAVRRRRSA